MKNQRSGVLSSVLTTEEEAELLRSLQIGDKVIIEIDGQGGEHPAEVVSRGRCLLDKCGELHPAVRLLTKPIVDFFTLDYGEYTLLRKAE